jgi:signal peptidase I
MNDGGNAAPRRVDTPTVGAGQVMPGSDPELEARLRKVRDEEAARERHRRLVRLERIVLVPALAIALLAWPNLGTAKVVGKSMEPTYSTGDTLIVLKTFRWFSPIKPGDVVVVRMKHGNIQGEDIVKRVVYIQNERGDAPWPKLLHSGRRKLPSIELFPDQVTGKDPVPRKGVMVMGDNLPKSMDSREFGAIADYEIIGKVILP